MPRLWTRALPLALGIVAGIGWMALHQAHAPTDLEVAQRACIDRVALSSHDAQDDDALAAETAACSTENL